MDELSSTWIGRAVALTESCPPGTAAPRPMYLIVVSGGIPGAMLRLSPKGDLLGRSGENTMRVSDLSVSRHHARIAIDPAGNAWVTDQGSTNGTFLNKERIVPYTPRRLDDGDRLQLGAHYVVKFVGLDACDERFQRDLFERSVRDGLTGLYNRAYFLDQIEALTGTGAARGLGVAVLMLDIDHFKRINDNHGHDAGDNVLREVAHVLRESTRSEDLVARYGGEEFVLAVPVASPDQAGERAERVRAAIAKRRINVPTVAKPLRVTASLGLAFSRHGGASSPEALVTAADHALYQAKNAGRNRIVFFDDRSPAEPTDSVLVSPRSTAD